jgi:hypothetical protein
MIGCRTIFQAEQDFECYVKLFRSVMSFIPMKELRDDILGALSMRTLSWSIGKIDQSPVGRWAFNIHT